MTDRDPKKAPEPRQEHKSAQDLTQANESPGTEAVKASGPGTEKAEPTEGSAAAAGQSEAKPGAEDEELRTNVDGYSQHDPSTEGEKALDSSAKAAAAGEAESRPGEDGAKTLDQEAVVDGCPQAKLVRDPSTEEAAKKARKKRKRQIAEIRSFFLRLAAMIIMLYVLFGIVFGVRAMPNDDMKPRISAGDLMLYYRLENRYVANDVVVFEKDGKTYTGRIVAQVGDTVEITDNSSLVVNGSTVVENDIYYSTPRYDTDVSYPLTLADDEYFLLCDYRTGAKDSRLFGAVNRSQFKGKVITVLRRSGL